MSQKSELFLFAGKTESLSVKWEDEEGNKHEFCYSVIPRLSPKDMNPDMNPVKTQAQPSTLACLHCDTHHGDDVICTEPHRDAHLHIDREEMFNKVQQLLREERHLLNPPCGAGQPGFHEDVQNPHEVDFHRYGMVVNPNCQECEEKRRTNQALVPRRIQMIPSFNTWIKSTLAALGLAVMFLVWRFLPQPPPPPSAPSSRWFFLPW
ncbi:hypothetical protein B0T21DRAFT_429733 [Apiosordaria backusii]|uniref:Uncharacterized protein n=1 Tax=Apiosordaria backusii TaxID=314023 RepID=A0AA40ESS6_9PEZI|nr:hypothetical protein B0T21DRAFT_429733 [Apiosordaria backusii]